MIDQNGNINRGWRISKPHQITAATKVSDGKEYPKGTLLRPCAAGCGKWVPYGLSFHFEECPVHGSAQ